jgi:ADP-heptose:LPS heptosyltransferase
VLGSSTSARPSRITIGIGHACSALNPERQLTPVEWTKLLATKFAADTAMTVELFGGPSDHEAAHRIIEALSVHFTAAEFIDSSAAYALGDLPARFSTLHEFWGIDSALIHIARLTHIKVVSIWGPSDPATRLRWLDPDKDVIFYHKMACSPCVHTAAAAPCCGENICIRALIGDIDGDAVPPCPGWVIS